MPRPVFGEVDCLTFSQLENTERFSAPDPDHNFATRQAAAADALAWSFHGEVDDGRVVDGCVTWPGLEFCVAKRSQRVLAFRVKEKR